MAVIVDHIVWQQIEETRVAKDGPDLTNILETLQFLGRTSRHAALDWIVAHPRRFLMGVNEGFKPADGTALDYWRAAHPEQHLAYILRVLRNILPTFGRKPNWKRCRFCRSQDAHRTTYHESHCRLVQLARAVGTDLPVYDRKKYLGMKHSVSATSSEDPPCRTPS